MLVPRGCALVAKKNSKYMILFIIYHKAFYRPPGDKLTFSSNYYLLFVFGTCLIAVAANVSGRRSRLEFRLFAFELSCLLAVF